MPVCISLKGSHYSVVPHRHSSAHAAEGSLFAELSHPSPKRFVVAFESSGSHEQKSAGFCKGKLFLLIAQQTYSVQFLQVSDMLRYGGLSHVEFSGGPRIAHIVANAYKGIYPVI